MTLNFEPERMTDYPCGCGKLMIVVSAILILPCGRTNRQRERESQMLMNALLTAVTDVGVSNSSNAKVLVLSAVFMSDADK